MEKERSGAKKKAEHSVRKEKPGLCPFFCYAKKKAVRVAHFFCKKKNECSGVKMQKKNG